MRKYIDAVQDLEKNLLPPNANLFWHDGSTEEHLARLLQDLKTLLKYKPELTDERQQKLQSIHNLLKNIYYEYAQHKPLKELLSATELDRYLVNVARWFRERYQDVNKNHFLKQLYRKVGCDMLFGRRVDVEGEANLQGPAIVAITHCERLEPFIIQSLTHNHIYWIGDPGCYIGDRFLRFFDIPLFSHLIKGVGTLEVDRESPLGGLTKTIKRCIYLLERNQLVGIAPIGATSDIGHPRLQKAGHVGIVFIIQQAEKYIKKKIPIIPIGVRKERKRFIVIFGKTQYIPQGKFNRKEYAQYLIGYLEKLRQ